MGEDHILLMVPRSEIDAFKNELEEIKSLITSTKKEDFLNTWLESEEARKQIGVSTKTWQTIRDKRVIPFSQFGRKIYFRQSDIDAFLNTHLVR